MAKRSDETYYEAVVQHHFNCDKPMAKLIIKSYKVNDKFENIEKLCELERRKKNGD